MTVIHTTLSPNKEILTLDIQGRFDFNALSLFKSTYEQLSPKPKTYILELARAEYLDSSALGMLVALRDYAGGDQADIRLRNPNADIKKILVITKLDELFNIES